MDSSLVEVKVSSLYLIDIRNCYGFGVDLPLKAAPPPQKKKKIR
jgi:hypothetical protein